MTAVVRGWAPEPHDAAPSEESCTCAWCGKDAEDGADVDATREEAEDCLPRVSLDHYGKIRLCDECDDQRIVSWEADDIASALDDVSEVFGVDPGIHPTEREGSSPRWRRS